MRGNSSATARAMRTGSLMSAVSMRGGGPSDAGMTRKSAPVRRTVRSNSSPQW